MTPTRRYDFWTLKLGVDGRIQDQMNTGVANNDILFCKSKCYKKSIESTERLTNWGLPMTSSMAEQGLTRHFAKPSFSISGWYYSCSSQSYTVFCKQESPANSPESSWLCLEVDSESQFIITLMLSGVETSYKVANFKAASGWTWFAITVEEIYANSILTFYAAQDSYTGLLSPTFPAKMETVTLTGFYTDPLPADKPNVKINLGCRRNSDQVCYRAMIGYLF